MSSLLQEQANFKKRLAAQPLLKRPQIARPHPIEPVAKKPKADSYFRDQRSRISTAAASPLTGLQGALSQANNQPRHVGTVVYDVINYLKKLQIPQSFEEIEIALGVDVKSSEEIRQRLIENTKIIFNADVGTLEYKPTYDLRTPDDLLTLLQSRTYECGTDIRDFKDCILNVREAAEALIKQGLVLAIRNKDNVPRYLFYNPHPAVRVDVNPEFKEEWNRLKVPDEADLSKELDRAGLKQMEVFQTVISDKDSKSKKPKARNRRVKITNTHLQGIDLTTDYVVEN